VRSGNALAWIAMPAQRKQLVRVLDGSPSGPTRLAVNDRGDPQPEVSSPPSPLGRGSGPGNLTTEARGAGEVVLDLGKVIPTRVRFDLQQDIEVDAGGTRKLRLPQV
jgi:hypothetical protein